jgi:hypothetical protein
VTGAVLIFDHVTWEGARNDTFSNLVKTPAPNPWLLDNDGELFCHDTVEGLADLIGVGRNLSTTLEDYNRAVQSLTTNQLPVPRTGKPKPLRAPYYGLRVIPGITFTMGGILVNVPLPRRHDEDIAFVPIEFVGRDFSHPVAAERVIDRRARVPVRLGLFVRP